MKVKVSYINIIYTIYYVYNIGNTNNQRILCKYDYRKKIKTHTYFPQKKPRQIAKAKDILTKPLTIEPVSCFFVTDVVIKLCKRLWSLQLAHMPMTST